MAWRFVKTNKLPLGMRILKTGCSGKDVEELQKLLSASGFYFGNIDGFYGVLTEEAVFLIQQAFNLRIDGIAGPMVLRVLRRISDRTGRLIYTVKPHEKLEAISQKFGVVKNAWESIPGQGNPRKKLYLGMRLLLYEKAIFAWDNRPPGQDILLTGQISSMGRIEETGELNLQEGELEFKHYYLIEAEPQTWQELLRSESKRRRLISGLRKIQKYKFGFDLRNAPENSTTIWADFLKNLIRRTHALNFAVVAVPIYLHKKMRYPLIEMNLLKISKCAHLVLLEPIVTAENQEQFKEEMERFTHFLKHIGQKHQFHQCIPVFSASGWEWVPGKETLNQVNYKEAKLIRAMNYQSVKYDQGIQYTFVNYYRSGENRQMAYRDIQGWLNLFEMVKKLNFLGIVIRETVQIKGILSECTAANFAVLPEEKLK